MSNVVAGALKLQAERVWQDGSIRVLERQRATHPSGGRPDGGSRITQAVRSEPVDLTAIVLALEDAQGMQVPRAHASVELPPREVISRRRRDPAGPRLPTCSTMRLGTLGRPHLLALRVAAYELWRCMSVRDTGIGIPKESPPPFRDVPADTGWNARRAGSASDWRWCAGYCVAWRQHQRGQ
jgi:hypothetical protein